MQLHRAVLCAGSLALTACAGDGQGLDANGRPAQDDDENVLTPQFESIQANVLTPICTTCHTGAAAPLGLRLDEGASYALLVRASSVEVPALLRVDPGNPDGSYLVQKLEGTAAVGARMPLGGPPLPPATIAVIRQWIADGAQPPLASESGVMNHAPSRIAAAWPVHDAVLRAAPSIVISARSELDAALLSAGTLTLQRAGGDDDFSSGNEVLLGAEVRLRTLSPTIFEVHVPAGEWAKDLYELRLSGSAPLAVTDLMSQPIDGDADGRPGGDFVLNFRLEDF